MRLSKTDAPRPTTRGPVSRARGIPPLPPFVLALARWLGQDYYSPQSVAYLLYLVLFCVVLGPISLLLIVARFAGIT